MGFDQTNFNIYRKLQADVLAANSAYIIAKASSEALSARASAFDTKLDEADRVRNVANDDLSTAKDAQKSILGTLDAALKAVDKATTIRNDLRLLYTQAAIAAETTIKAAYSVSNMLTVVANAEAKNALITKTLLSDSQQADSDAANAVKSVIKSLDEVGVAFVNSNKALVQAQLTTVSIIDMFSVMSGYKPTASKFTPLRSDSLSWLISSDTDDLTVLLKGTVSCIQQELDDHDSGKKSCDRNSNPSTPLYILHEAEMDLSKVTDSIAGSSNSAEPALNKGMLPMLNYAATIARQRAELFQDATAEAVIELALANQELADRENVLNVARAAFAAAENAVL